MDDARSELKRRRRLLEQIDQFLCLNSSACLQGTIDRTHQDIRRQYIRRPHHARSAILCQDTTSFSHEFRSRECLDGSLCQQLFGESPVIVSKKLSVGGIEVEKGDVR